MMDLVVVSRNVIERLLDVKVLRGELEGMYVPCRGKAQGRYEVGEKTK